MADWYYIDSEGQKQGPYTGRDILHFAHQGTITANTMVEDPNGRTCPARVLLRKPAAQTPSPPPPDPPQPPPKPPVGPNPFTNTLPAQASSVAPQIPEDDDEPDAKRSKLSLLISTFVILLVLGVGGFCAWKFFVPNPLHDALKRGLDRDVLTNLRLENVHMKVTWTEKSAKSASGNFTVTAKSNAALYNAVGNEAALRKLGITDLHEREFNEVQISRLSEPRRTVLLDARPKDLPKFYDVVVPKDEKVTLTGSVKLIKNGKEWKTADYLVDPFTCGDVSFHGEKVVPGSKLPDAALLDDPNTKEMINDIVQGRKNYVAKFQEFLKEEEIIAAPSPEPVRPTPEPPSPPRKPPSTPVNPSSNVDRKKKRDAAIAVAVSILDELRDRGIPDMRPASDELKALTQYGRPILMGRLREDVEIYIKGDEFVKLDAKKKHRRHPDGNCQRARGNRPKVILRRIFLYDQGFERL